MKKPVILAFLALFTLIFCQPAGAQRLRIMAANLSSGNLQSYDPGHGANIMKGLQPDIVLIQEFNYANNSTSDLRGFVTNTFGASYSYYHQGDYQIPNGIISRYPILASGSWDDPQVSNREFAWARIDIPGTKDLWAVSVHMLTTDSKRPPEAIALRDFIQANVPEGDYFVLGGDFNSDSRTEAMFTTLSAVVRTAGPYPADKNGNMNTNAGRNSPYDAVLPDEDLYALQIPVVIGSQTFTNGLVVDTRVFTPISDIAPALASDSAASGMQHMGVVRDFQIPAQGPAILTSTLPGATVGGSYSQTLTASGGTAPYIWSVTTGSLPAGITLGSGGVLSGTASATGSPTFTVQAQDATGAKTTRSFTITVNPALALVSTSPLAGGTINRAYSQTFAASGGFPSYTWTSTGTLPAGLTFSSAGVLGGTPTAAGTFTFTARVTDSTSTAVSGSFTVTINPAPVISSASPFVGGTVGAAYSQQVAVTGGTPPFTWAVSSGTLRPGLTFSAAGLLSGMPTTAGTGSFTARVTDAAGATTTKSLSVTIAAAPVISSTSPLAGGTVGSQISRTLAGTGGTSPYAWTIASGTLPEGVGLSEAGVLSGIPTAAGSFSITVRLTDGAGAVVTKSFAISIVEPVAAYLAAAGLPSDSLFIDSDNDGIANLLEFLLGGNPKASDASIVPVIRVSADGTSVSYTFRVTSSPGSVGWRIQSSVDLVVWDDIAPGGTTILSATPGPSGTNDIMLTMPAPAGSFYLRLAVAGP